MKKKKKINVRFSDFPLLEKPSLTKAIKTHFLNIKHTPTPAWFSRKHRKTNNS